MSVTKTITLLSVGAVFGVGMVLSCGDNAPRSLDAATCDCPASEPPIAGRLLVIEGAPGTVQAGAQGVAGASCPPGLQFLSGTCTNDPPTSLEDITLVQFGLSSAGFGWSCVFRNNKTVPVSVKATVVCLKPPT
jgi:hypothetical protein